MDLRDVAVHLYYGSMLYQVTTPDDEHTPLYTVRTELVFLQEKNALALSDRALRIGSKPWYIAIPHVLTYGDFHTIGLCMRRPIPVLLPDGTPPPWGSLWLADPRTVRARIEDNSFVIDKMGSPTARAYIEDSSDYLLAHICSRVYHFAGEPQPEIRDYSSEQRYYVDQNQLVYVILVLCGGKNNLFPQEFIHKHPDLIRPVFFDELLAESEHDFASRHAFNYLFLPKFY